MNITKHLAAVSLLAILGAAPAAYALNIAGATYGGSGICGINSNATRSAFGTTLLHSGTAASINDNNTTTGVDTYGSAAGTLSFVGIRWPFLRADSVKTLTFTMNCFGDGGWFGFAGVGPGAGGALTSASHLLEPQVQITTDGGVTWTAVDATSNYITVMEGAVIPVVKTFTVTLDAPVPGINGIRLIGENGGTGDTNGFLGVRELVVDASAIVDTDADGMEDSWEEAHGGMANLGPSPADKDGDGLTDYNEFLANVDPQDTDSDDDGLLDGPEVLTHQSNPGDSDTDDDGLNDGFEVNTSHTSPRLADTDADGLSDSAEINTHLTDPLDADSDDDQFTDGLEVLTYFTNPKSQTSHPANIARAIGTAAHFGYNNALDTDNGTTYSQQGTTAAILNQIIDGSFTTRIDTYNATSTNPVSFAGLRWATAWPLPVSRIEITMACFQDGGWFGPSNASPGPGNMLTSPAYLTEPTIQTTTDGNTWTNASVTSNYTSSFTNFRIGGNGQPNPTTRKAIFLLNTPVTGLRGIRIIGSEGGVAGNTGSNKGFIGVFEITVEDTSTSPANDFDRDGLTDADEVIAGTSSTDDDSDDDGLLDGAEVNTWHTNPLNPDTDGDHFRDIWEVGGVSDPLVATSFPNNVALLGTAIFGTNAFIDGTTGTPYVHEGVAGNINDGNPATRVDSFGATPGSNSYAGIVWSAPQTVKTLTMNFSTFYDGGWFGPNAIDPGNGGALDLTHLTEPETQISTDGGLTWVTVPHTSDYLTAFNGHLIGNFNLVNPTSRSATFTLDTAAVVTGIRLIGSEGGTASAGFLGCFELAVGQGPVAGDADNDGLPDAWEITNFGYVHAQHLRTDGDGDGSDNLLEYGFGMNPNLADQPPAGVEEAGYLTMTISKKPGVVYQVLTGSDLTGWGTAETTVITDDATTLKVRDNVPIATGPRRFLKGTVSPAP